MARKRTIYDNMNAGDLARITRERGLQKPDVLHIVEWADWLAEQDAKQDASKAPTENVAAQTSESNDYGSMSNRDLRALAKERGITLHDRTEIIDALQAADGMTEDQQAAQDNGEAS
jgi:hypothetical protein